VKTNRVTLQFRCVNKVSIFSKGLYYTIINARRFSIAIIL